MTDVTRKRPAIRDRHTDKSDDQVVVQGEKLKAELDDLLDEIDQVLETNADEFVKGYVQKGGQ